LQARRSALFGATLLFLLLLGMTLGLRVRVLPARSLALATSEHAAPARARRPLVSVATSRPRLRAVRRTPGYSTLAATAPVDVPELEALELPAPVEEAPPLTSSIRLDIPALASPDHLTMSPPAFVPATRPTSLAPLYGTFAVLQSMDAITTLKALQQPGVREANPIVRPFANSVPAMVALKSASTIVTVAAVEKLWRRNRAAAVATMIGINVAYGIVVSHNAATLR
jgi:hypothetical protein